MKLILLVMALFLFELEQDGFFVTATIYHATAEQCNADFLTTASGKKINESNPIGHRWIAVSRDLEQLGFKMGEKVMIEGADDLSGVWTIQDRMNKRWTQRIDFLVNKTRKGGKWNNVIIKLIE